MRKFLCLPAIILSLAAQMALASDPADPEACLAAPTQPCVFDLAIEVVETEANPTIWGRTLLSIALLQEEAGSDDHLTTLEHFLATAGVRRENAARSVVLQVYGTLGLPPAGRPIDAPETIRYLADHLLRIYDEAPELDAMVAASSISGLYARAGDLDRAFTFLQGFPPADRDRGLGGLAYWAATARNWAALDRVYALASTQAARDAVAWQATSALLPIGELDRALEAILRIDATNSRVFWLTKLVDRLADADRLAEAHALTQRLVESGALDDFPIYAEDLATTFAELGDENALRSALIPVVNNHPQRVAEMLPDLDITLRIATGDWATALDPALADIGAQTGQTAVIIRVEGIATLMLQSGAADLTALADRIPLSQTDAGHFALLAALVRAERFENARALADQVQASGFRPEAQFNWVYQRLETHLAQNGHAIDAIHRAHARRDALSLALLAAMID